MQLHAPLQRHAAQGVRRYVSGHDDDRNIAVKMLAQLYRRRQPVHSVRQIVVRDHEVGLERVPHRQFQRRDAIGSRRYAMHVLG